MMNEFQSIFFFLEHAGVIAFSISGAMIAIDEELDLFGVLFLAIITALGGGTLRDTLLGRVPSPNFFDYSGITLSLLTAAIVFMIAYRNKEYYYSHEFEIEHINNIVDSIGLGFFTVSGVQVTLEAGYRSNYFLLIFMGMLTGVGGGLIRDVIAKRVPLILSKHIYAIASMLCSVCYLLSLNAGLNNTTAVIISVIFVVAIRMFSTLKRLNMPRVKKD